MADHVSRLLPSSRAGEAGVAWRELESRLPAPGLMCSWDWTSLWLEQWGDVVEHWFLLLEGGSGPVGAALLTRSRRLRVGPAAHIHVGTAGEPRRETVFVEGNRLLAEPGARAGLAEAIVAALPRLPRHRGLALDGFVPEDAQLLSRAAGVALELQASPFMDLAAVRAEGGDVLSALGSGVRRRIRQSLTGFGEIAVEWARTPTEASGILEELIELHRARWSAAGVPGAFSAERTTAFHRRLVAAFAADGRAMLLRARAGGRTLGCLYGHIDGSNLLFYQSGFGVFGDNRLRPGLVTHLLAMQGCLDRGLDAYEFLAGEARYKDELSSGRRTLAWAAPEPPRVERALLSVAKRARGELRGIRGDPA